MASHYAQQKAQSRLTELHAIVDKLLGCLEELGNLVGHCGYVVCVDGERDRYDGNEFLGSMRREQVA